MQTEVGGVVLRERFKIFPEGFGVFFILREMIGASESECPAEAGGFPNVFNIVVRNVKRETFNVFFVFCPMAERFGVSEVKRGEFAKNADLSTDDFIRFFEKGGFSFFAEGLGELFAGGKGEERVKR